MSDTVIQKVEFEKCSDGLTSSCTIEKFNDGSVYVAGEELGDAMNDAADEVEDAVE